VGIWWGGVIPRANAEPWSLQAERPTQSRGWDPFADDEDPKPRRQQRAQQSQPRRQAPPSKPISEKLNDQVDSAKESWNEFRSDVRYQTDMGARRMPRWAGEVGQVVAKIVVAGAAGGAGVFVYKKVDQLRTERVRRGLKGATGIERDGNFLDGKGYWRSPDAPIVSGTYRGPAPPPMTSKYAFQGSKTKSPGELAAMAEFLTVEINGDAQTANSKSADSPEDTIATPAKPVDIAEVDMSTLQEVLPELQREMALEAAKSILAANGVDARELRDQLAARGMNVLQMLEALSKLENQKEKQVSEESRQFFAAFRAVLEEDKEKESKPGEDGSGLRGRRGYTGGR